MGSYRAALPLLRPTPVSAGSGQFSSVGSFHARLLVQPLPLPRDDLVTPASNVIAESLHGENRERLLKLSGKLLDAKHENGGQSNSGDLGNVVPASLERLIKRKWEEEQPR